MELPYTIETEAQARQFADDVIREQLEEALESTPLEDVDESGFWPKLPKS